MSQLRSPIVFIFTYFFVLFSAFAESHTVTVAADSGSGYVGTLQFASGISNCYGEVSAAFGNEEFIPSGYVYKGKTYSPQDVGLDQFKKVRLGSTDLSADLYIGAQNLGRLTMKNVIFFSGTGCFGETYHITKLLGLDDKEYRSRLKELSLNNFSISAKAVDYKIEMKIDEKDEAAKAELKELETKKNAELKEKEMIKNAAMASQAPTATPPPNTVLPKSTPENYASAARVSPAAKTAGSAAANAAEAEQKKAAQAAVADQRANQYALEMAAQLERDQAQAQIAAHGTAAATAGFVQGISGTGTGLGVSILYANETPKNSRFEPLLIGIILGKTVDSADNANRANLLSGIETQMAINPDIFESDPTVLATPKYASSNKRYGYMIEFKFFGNFESFGWLQPYGGIGYAHFEEFSAILGNIGSGWELTKGFGLAIPTAKGFLRAGYNMDLKVIDLGFAVHM